MPFPKRIFGKQAQNYKEKFKCANCNTKEIHTFYI